MSALQPEVTTWRSAPVGRGTFNLLFSCVVTLSLCVYTSLHLNVSGQGERKARRFFRKIKWAVIGVFAPELVLFTAWSQWYAARILSNDFKVAMKTENFSIKHWTMTHSFFAGMGGYVIDTCAKSPDERDFVHGSPRLTITGAGALFLAQHGCLPDISEKAIADKSKADPIAKSLACVQACWLIIQCITRLATGLPVTLLEVATIAHCFCALGMYILWWKKPLDISEPILLTHPFIRQMAAFMVEDSPAFYVSIESGNRAAPDPITGRSWYHDSSKCRQSMVAEASEIFAITPGERLRALGPQQESNMRHPATQVTLRSLNWAKDQEPTLSMILTTIPRYEGDLPLEKTYIWAWLAFTIATASYGGLHCAAWFSYFPTSIEALMWRLSSICVASAGIMVTIASRSANYLETTMIYAYHYTKRPALLRPLFWLVMVGVIGFAISFCALIGAYIVSRCFLVVEAFISLRLLPVTAYETPQWTQWVPHL